MVGDPMGIPPSKDPCLSDHRSDTFAPPPSATFAPSSSDTFAPVSGKSWPQSTHFRPQLWGKFGRLQIKNLLPPGFSSGQQIFGTDKKLWGCQPNYLIPETEIRIHGSQREIHLHTNLLGDPSQTPFPNTHLGANSEIRDPDPWVPASPFPNETLLGEIRDPDPIGSRQPARPPISEIHILERF